METFGIIFCVVMAVMIFVAVVVALICLSSVSEEHKVRLDNLEARFVGHERGPLDFRVECLEDDACDQRDERRKAESACALVAALAARSVTITEEQAAEILDGFFSDV